MLTVDNIITRPVTHINHRGDSVLLCRPARVRKFSAYSYFVDEVRISRKRRQDKATRIPWATTTTPDAFVRECVIGQQRLYQVGDNLHVVQFFDEYDGVAEHCRRVVLATSGGHRFFGKLVDDNYSVVRLSAVGVYRPVSGVRSRNRVAITLPCLSATCSVSPGEVFWPESHDRIAHNYAYAAAAVGGRVFVVCDHTQKLYVVAGNPDDATTVSITPYDLGIDADNRKVHVTTFAVDPDGNTLAVVVYVYSETTVPRNTSELRVYKLGSSGRADLTQRFQIPAQHVSFSPDGATLAVLGSADRRNYTLSVIDME